MKKLNTWHFEKDNDKLVKLVLKGIKTARTSLYKNNRRENENLPKVGDISILIFDNEKKACITKITKVIITEFKNITEELAYLEGEENRSLEYYKKAYGEYFKTIDSNFNENSKIIFEVFEIVEDLTKLRIQMAQKIVDANENIFLGKKHCITEVNAGFNNDIFNIDDQYIIKVCANLELENEFEREVEFYDKNSSSKHIAKLYKYDNTKSVVPFVYEILQKINGKSLYYHWYRMDENRREETIKKIVNVLKEIHKKNNIDYDWLTYIKDQITNCYEKVKHYFSDGDKKVIESSFKEYDKYLSDNQFSLIHNDLHFDNILVENDKLYLIDFNDIMIAPIDYDLRIFYMCKETPWKWANTEMDPYQKKEDYQNIDQYLKKYYDEFANIKYIDERMIIYRILNDIKLLTRYNNQELKENVINYSKRLINNKE